MKKKITDKKKNQETNRIDSFVKSADSFGFGRSVHMCNRRPLIVLSGGGREGDVWGNNVKMSKAHAHAQNDISCFMWTDKFTWGVQEVEVSDNKHFRLLSWMLNPGLPADHHFECETTVVSILKPCTGKCDDSSNSSPFPSWLCEPLQGFQCVSFSKILLQKIFNEKRTAICLFCQWMAETEMKRIEFLRELLRHYIIFFFFKERDLPSLMDTHLNAVPDWT